MPFELQWVSKGNQKDDDVHKSLPTIVSIMLGMFSNV